MSHTYLESHGVRLDVEVQAEELLAAVQRILPPGWRPSTQFPEDGHFVVAHGPDGTYDVFGDGAPLATGLTAEVAVHVVDAQLRARIALLAHDRIFVHAGVVAVADRAIVMPAASFAGKSVLVAELVGLGATYFSDEFAVLDADGNVHPYAKPLSIRRDDERYGDLHTAEALGGRSSDHTARPALIAITRYVPGATWAPESRNGGVGALALLTNAVPAQTRVKEATRAAARAAAGALVLEGPRGDARRTAEALLAALG